MGIGYNPLVVSDKLIACIDAGNQKSYSGTGTTLIDIAGSRSASFSPAIFNNNNGIDFSGNALANFGTTTVDVSSGYTCIIIAKWSNFNGGSFQLNQAPMYINFYSGGDSKLRWETYGGNAMRTSASLVLNQTTFVAGTFSGTTTAGGTGISKTYINGVLDNTTTLQSGSSVSGPFILGEYAGYFSGTLYYFSFYNKELSAAEITQNFNALRGRFGI